MFQTLRLSAYKKNLFGTIEAVIGRLDYDTDVRHVRTRWHGTMEKEEKKRLGLERARANRGT